MNTTKGINQLIDEFLSLKDCRDNTIDTYRRKLRLWVNWMISNGDLKNPTTQQLIAYKKYLIDSGHKEQTIDGYTAAIKMLFRWLSDQGIHEDISRQIKWVRRTIDHEKGYLTPNQVASLLTIMPKDTAMHQRNYAIVNLMARVGLRCIEVTRLDRSDLIHRDPRHFIRIQRKGQISKSATIEIPRNAYSPIDAYLATDLFAPLSDPLFRSMGSRPGRRITTKTIGRIVTDSFQLIGIKDKRYTAHSLRHTAAMCASKAGAANNEIQQMLGHGSVTTTERYLRELQRDNAEATAAIRLLDKAYEIN